jgi:hypothetical protein
MILDDAKMTVYANDITNNYSICGDPELIDDMTFVGHMVNDGICGKSVFDNTKEHNKYDRKKLEKNNAQFVLWDQTDFLVKVIALTDIRQNEEILVSYGYDYWINLNNMQSKKKS